MAESVAVIDGDLLARMAADATTERHVIATHKTTAVSSRFATLTAFREWLSVSEDEGGETAYEVIPHQDGGDAQRALDALDTLLQSVFRRSGCDKFHVVLSGLNNFRLALPLPTRYKAKREGLVSPPHLRTLKDALLGKWGAELSSGCEADDLLVAYTVQGYNSEKRVVHCTVDKDAMHGPGWVFNWKTMSEPMLIEGYGGLYIADNASKSVKGTGHAFFWFQVLFGDPVDDYTPYELAKKLFGAKSFGEKSAYKLLSKCKDVAESIATVVSKYREWYPEPFSYHDWSGKFHADVTWVDMLQLYIDCAWMRRWDGDRLDARKLLKKYNIE